MTSGGIASSAAPLNATKIRSADIDAVRVLGIVAVVIGHIWTVGIIPDAFYAWHVPVFFILTGYLWKATGRTVKDEAQRRAWTLLVPYAAWLFILGVAYFGSLLARDQSIPIEEVRNAIYGGYFAVRPFSAFWFVTVLFFATVLFRFLSRFPAWVGWGLALTGLLATQFAGELMAKTPMAIALAVPCLAFLIMGREFPRLQRRVKHKVVTGLTLIIVGLGLVFLDVLKPLHIKNGDFGTPLFSVLNAASISFGLILIASSVYQLLPGAVHQLTIRLAGVGFVVVLTHAFFLFLLNTPAMGTWLDVGVAIIVPWALGFLLVRTPARKWLVG